MGLITILKSLNYRMNPHSCSNRGRCSRITLLVRCSKHKRDNLLKDMEVVSAQLQEYLSMVNKINQQQPLRCLTVWGVQVVSKPQQPQM